LSAWSDYWGRVLELEIHGFTRTCEDAISYGRAWASSLTRGIDGDRAKRALTSSLVSFGEEMGIAIVAEGIETAEELDALIDLGVPFGQGFYLAEPAPL